MVAMGVLIVAMGIVGGNRGVWGGMVELWLERGVDGGNGVIKTGSWDTAGDNGGIDGGYRYCGRQ